MNKRFLGILAASLLLVLTFMTGRWTENALHGYHYSVLEEKDIPSATGLIHWKSVVEYQGFSVLETDTTLLEVDGRLIYKAKRTFQERDPSARNVKANNELIQWDDGEYAYSLKMQKLPPGSSVTQPSSTPALQPPAPKTSQPQQNAG